MHSTKKNQIYYCNVNEARFKDGMHNKRFFLLKSLYSGAHTAILHCIVECINELKK